jgi:transcriptional regulator with XRE-family HTH domain
MESFGQYLKRLRETKNLTLTEVAEQAGINHSHLSRIESGLRNPPKATTMQKLAVALGVPFIELMEKAGQWDRLDSEEKQQLANLYANDEKNEQRILSILKHIATDENTFPGIMHEGIFRIFGELSMMGHQGEKFYKWYSMYLDRKISASQGELEDVEAEFPDAYEEFNKFYNYSTLKNQIENYNSSETNQNILSWLEQFTERHGYYSHTETIPFVIQENSPSYAPEKEFVDKIDLSDEELAKQFKITVDGRPLSEQEMKKIIAFVRMERSFGDRA